MDDLTLRFRKHDSGEDGTPAVWHATSEGIDTYFESEDDSDAPTLISDLWASIMTSRLLGD